MNKRSTPRHEVDRRNAVHPEAFVFSRSKWEFRGSTMESFGIVPASIEPGSWSKPPEWMGKYATAHGKVRAWVSCPNCGGVSMICDGVTRSDILGKLTPDFICTHGACGFHRTAYLDNWNDRVLYACSYWGRGARGPEIKIHYTHGNSVAMARAELGASCRDEDVIAIGPAVGFFVDEKADRQGNILTAD